MLIKPHNIIIGVKTIIIMEKKNQKHNEISMSYVVIRMDIFIL